MLVNYMWICIAHRWLSSYDMCFTRTIHSHLPPNESYLLSLASHRASRPLACTQFSVSLRLRGWDSNLHLNHDGCQTRDIWRTPGGCHLSVKVVLVKCAPNVRRQISDSTKINPRIALCFGLDSTVFIAHIHGGMARLSLLDGWLCTRS